MLFNKSHCLIQFTLINSSNKLNTCVLFHFSLQIHHLYIYLHYESEFGGYFGGIIMIKWLRSSNISGLLLAIIRVYLGILWLMSGIEKVGGFTAEKFIAAAIKNPVVGPTGHSVYGWFTSILESFVAPNIGIFNFLVAWGEVFIGLGLIFGAFTTAATFFALMMNFSYLLAGSISVNPQYIFLEFIVIIAGYNAGKIGLDRFIIPFIREKVPFLKNSVEGY